jgi:hypothetical protein
MEINKDGTPTGCHLKFFFAFGETQGEKTWHPMDFRWHPQKKILRKTLHANHAGAANQYKIMVNSV